MIVNPSILEEIYDDAGLDRKQKAERYVNEKRVNITKVTYNNPGDFELSSKVMGNGNIYDIYIYTQNNEIQDVKCTCQDYENTYSACKHVAATIMEFSENNQYLKIFGGENKNKQNDIDMYKKYNKHEEKYRVFRQLINNFYNKDYEKNKEQIKNVLPKTIIIEPKIIYSSYNKTLKLELKIGQKQLYKIKDLPEFYSRMQNKEFYKYGSKLQFTHSKDVFEDASIPILNYILKYAEIIKYANESVNNYGYYGRTINDSYITLSNTGIDELFEILKGKEVLFQKEHSETKILFVDKEPKIEFKIQENERNEYKIVTNIDIYEYEIIEGKDNVYILINNVLYKCSNEFKENSLKILNIFKSNYTNEINFNKNDLGELFSIVFPKIRKNINIDILSEEEKDKYIPQELFVKLYLDYDKNNYITADIKFIYGDIEFNPLLENTPNIGRDVPKEDEIINMFINSGFMLDIENKKLILTSEELIYNFLSNEIEIYMQKFEVLATEEFKKKEIREPKVGNIGVRVENHLLKLDFSDVDFDISELKQIMEKYKLKKKYFRLKDGSFLNLEENNSIEFIDNVISGLDIDYKEIEKGEIKLPIYRTMYLDRLLQDIKGANIVKNEEYKKIVNKVSEKEIKEEILLPKKLNADLRNYQRVGYEWLKVLDNYKFGGILADDMGLGKTLQLITIILSYVENEENSKPSIVICPSSLSLNWQNEIEKFSPTLKSQVIRGNAEERKKQIRNILKYNIIITSYDLLKRDIEIYKELNYEFKYIIADEAQYIKNNNTQNAKAIKEIIAETRYALTGTPIENSLSELWSIFDFIMPGYLFSYRKFKELYEMPIVREEDKKAMKKLKMLIEPFVLRRIKKEVLTELPDKTITTLNNEMQEEQLKIYMSYMQSAKRQAIEEINSNGFERSQIKILALLMRLRQICCHPSLFIENYKGESSKLNQCIEIVKDAVHSGHKILLFSSYSGMFDIIQKELDKQDIKYFKLTGKTKVGDRIKLVDEFNENDKIKVFLISLKAGGTGLNLIGADMVIHYDPWWNISAENQATDRTYRIGQKRNVQVYKLITKNSIEEKIYELQERKSKLIDNMLSTNETFINKLSKEDIMELFK